jgi:hypothetical protein
MGAETLIVARHLVLERAIKMTRKLQKMQGNTAAVAASAVMAAAVKAAGRRLAAPVLLRCKTLPLLRVEAAEAEAAEAAVLGRPI